MTKPVRLQLSRKKGFDLQALSRATNGLGAVKVARPSRWGNPFVVGSYVASSRGDHYMTAAEAVEQYRQWVSCIRSPEERAAIESMGLHAIDISDITRYLRGLNLACFCKILNGRNYVPCHADVLLEIANR